MAATRCFLMYCHDERSLAPIAPPLLQHDLVQASIAGLVSIAKLLMVSLPKQALGHCCNTGNFDEQAHKGF